VNTLKRVLDHHYDPRRTKLNLDGPAPDLSQPAKPPTALPGYASWSEGKKFDKRTADAGCLHCHQVGEVLRQPSLDAHTFDKVRDTQIWPLPENVGIKLDRDDGLRVTEVTADSPAVLAGIKAGDELAAADGRLLFSQTDFRGVLHRGPQGAGSIELVWMHDGKPMTGTLNVTDGWRKTDLGWRASIANGNIGVSPGFFPVPASKADRDKYHLPENTMAVKPFGISPEAAAAGLTRTSIVTAVSDDSRNLSARPFLVWFRMNHQPGDRVTFTIKEPSGEPKQITYTLAKPVGG
jgi:S1-C subfamily serine protease